MNTETTAILIAYLVMIPIGYLLGALPFGLILGRLFKGVDVREYGSGKTGMTNVMRTAGIPAAALSLALDMGKSIAVVALARFVLFPDVPGAHAAGAIAVLVGHNWSVFIGFKGGRGTAPGWGGLIMLSPWSGLVATLVGLPVVGLSRYVSLGSILGTLSGVITLAVLIALGRAPVEYIAYSVIGAALVIGLHKDNIQRLLSGTERKIGQSALPTE
ncbi:MAG: glycerol-3-phosphate 1-O-acyltransferase PlsY [Chloroflexi bacterium]|nr:glycerol-3-phosphate 1-O-acyltransferase PlsY [Chloroflexota bacterium]MYC08262.1 glycerol-3-phosphate 1-O-acyltransferase PlsY [Chloroflexota bacterium]